MLVIARGPGQSIVLDNRITVTVLAGRGSTVRLGIDAPIEIGVRRGELGPAAESGAVASRPPDGPPVG